ncbi:hypothetical protein BP6252_06472 [Coleophoma cylindrospora]|uniref:HlyIII-domain-containing protein n=1 Tax=Coleophoma cylindrospora TaxID=1849047 RepID=A0A3D8RN09_9HELO|nr:hypothetical protein BP6252_06472 [Coleophoma cylindrospora]
MDQVSSISTAASHASGAGAATYNHDWAPSKVSSQRGPGIEKTSPGPRKRRSTLIHIKMSQDLQTRKTPAPEGLEARDSKKETEQGKGWRLLTLAEMPEWHQDNSYLIRGYRPISQSVRRSVSSWFYMHNETLNIHTHLVPSVFFLLAQFGISTYFAQHYPLAQRGDQLIFSLFFASAAICLGLSAAYHTLMNHSHVVSEAMLRLDFVGIMILILGKFVSGIYVGFKCEPFWRMFYWGMIMSLGSISITLVLNPKYQGREYRTFRLLSFVGTAMSGFVPIIHGVLLYGLAQSWKQSGMKFYLLEGVFLALGAVFYSMRIPESVKPGRFDIVGASHQIFHVLVVVAACVHLWGILDAYDYGYQNLTCRVI